jgi:hypothetical protein
MPSKKSGASMKEREALAAPPMKFSGLGIDPFHTSVIW